MAGQSNTDQRVFTAVLVIGVVMLVGVGVYLFFDNRSAAPEPDISTIRTFTDPIEEDSVVAYAQLADADTLALGETVYQTHCAACHGANGEGQFPDAPMQPDATGRIGAPPHDETGHTWHHDDDLLIRYVIEGGQAPPDRFYPMPAFGETLSEDEVLAVIAYIKTMWTEEQRLMQAENTLTRRENQ